MIESRFLVQVDTLDAVTSGRQRDGVIHHGRFGVGLAVPSGLAAEEDRSYRALNRRNGQVQGVDTVFAGAGLVGIGVRVGTGDATEVGQAVPCEIIAFADRERFLEMVTRLIFGQNQTVDIVTSGGRIRVLILVGTCSSELLLARRTMVDILPCETVIVCDRTACLIDNRLIHNDMYVHQRVASQVTAVMTGFVVRDAVEADSTAFANRKRSVALNDLTNGQIQYIQGIIAICLLYQAAVMIRLVCGDTVPFIGQLVRTNGKCSRNRIYLIVSELQDGNGVATEAVRAVMEVHTRITNRLAVPYVGLAFGTLDSQIGGVRTEDVERQNNHAVATSCLVIGMTIDTTLGKRLICKDISLSLTHRMLDQRLRDIANSEVQHMDHAVVTCRIFLHFGVLTGYRIGLAVIAPYMGLARTDRYRLFVAIDLLVDVRSDDTVATEG